MAGLSMRIFKRLAVFLCANLLLSLALQFLLSAPSQQPIRYAEFERGEYNAVILGHSLAERGFAPAELQTEEGDRVFNFCIGGAPFHNLPYLLMGLQETHPLKKVYLELYWPYWTEKLYGVNYVDYDNQLLDMLPESARRAFIKEERLFENYNKTLFPYKLDSGTLNQLGNLPEALRIKTDPRYREKSPEMLSIMNDPEEFGYGGDGFVYVKDGAGYLDGDYPFRQFSERKLSREAIEDFDRIVDFCRENGIELICLESALLPIRLQNENHGESHDWFAALCRSRNVAYYDMNYVDYALLPRGAEDYSDTDGHMAVHLARRQTGLLKQILQSEEPDRFFEPDYEAVLAGMEAYGVSNP